ncbi:MAG: hypothetical protein H7039_13390, partial [Bryobacteraceae bacterium]|nr:hypothetical protein [Bryobacteraceae bacterium]
EAGGQRSSAVTMLVQNASPAWFTADSTGLGQIAALNQDGSLNRAGNGAVRGSVLVLYGTGEGLVTPLPASGGLVSELTRPVLPVSVLIGGVPAAIEYAGGAPGLVSGLLQVNVRVPESSPVGDAVPVVLLVGEFRSVTGTTATIR